MINKDIIICISPEWMGCGHAHAGEISLKYNDDIMIVLRLQMAVDAVYSND